MRIIRSWDRLKDLPCYSALTSARVPSKPCSWGGRQRRGRGFRPLPRAGAAAGVGRVLPRRMVGRRSGGDRSGGGPAWRGGHGARALGPDARRSTRGRRELTLAARHPVGRCQIRAGLAAYRGLDEDLRRRLANPPAVGMAGPSLLWLRDHEPDAYASASWALQPKDWLRMRLTGEVAAEPSDASATLLYDLPADEWSHAAVEDLGLRAGLLAPLVPPPTSPERSRAEAAGELGLRRGTTGRGGGGRHGGRHARRGAVAARARAAHDRHGWPDRDAEREPGRRPAPSDPPVSWCLARALVLDGGHPERRPRPRVGPHDARRLLEAKSTTRPSPCRQARAVSRSCRT